MKKLFRSFGELVEAQSRDRRAGRNAPELAELREFLRGAIFSEPLLVHLRELLFVERREVELDVRAVFRLFAAEPVAQPELEDGVFVDDFDDRDGWLVAVFGFRVRVKV